MKNMNTRDEIKRLVHAEIVRQEAMLVSLDSLPEDIIARACECFEGPSGALRWLDIGSHPGLGGRSVFEAAKTPEGLAEVRRLISAIDYGVYL